MAISDAVLTLYLHLKKVGCFDGIESVVELGSQTVWCQRPDLLKALFAAFDRPLPPDAEFDKFIDTGGTGTATSRSLHEYLGFNKYTCVDIDGNFGALTLDLNFDDVPPEHCGQYGLTTNHGTAEHILNQFGTFKAIHDFTAPGGLMLHVSPFIGWPDHGFFNYQPNFFQAIARYNSYELLAMWLNIDPKPVLIPWCEEEIKKFNIEPGVNYLLVTLLRKTSDAEFFAPIQRCYESMVPEASRARYRSIA